jgi:uncharacterized membrane protein
MNSLLFTIFSAVCGQNPAHAWAPGGHTLPCCERCAGLYAGALAAMVLRLWFRPPADGRSLKIHAFFLLQLGLFVLPWAPQWPALRTISGALFGFGVVAFLWPAVADWLPEAKGSPHAGVAYGLGLASCLVLTPAIAAWGGAAGAFLLTWLLLCGLVGLFALAGANLVRCLVSVGAFFCFDRHSFDS